jgi:hypothetical protein
MISYFPDRQKKVKRRRLQTHSKSNCRWRKGSGLSNCRQIAGEGGEDEGSLPVAYTLIRLSALFLAFDKQRKRQKNSAPEK